MNCPEISLGGSSSFSSSRRDLTVKLRWRGFPNHRRLAATVRFLRHAQILDFDEAAIQRYDELKRLRLKVRKMDLQIAATALQHDGTVVTRNSRDFKAVPGLAVEDWSK